MKILFATFDSPDDFLQRLEVAKGAATLHVRTKARYDEGEQVILEIGYPGLPNRILTRATALEPRKGKKADGEQSFKLDKGEEHKRDFLIAVAAGRATASWKRRHRRFPMRMAARFVVEGEDVPLRGDAETEDMGSGGVSLRTSRTLPDGAKVTIVLEPGDGSEPIEFSGRVVWNRNDDSVTGVGVQFESLGGDQMRRLRKMIRDVKLRGETKEG
jgi:Tfp pilus assembly protein PilZ